MPAVHGQYARPCRVVMERRVRTAAGRTNLDRGQCAAAASPSPSQLPGVKAMVQLRKEREARQRDADGELPGGIGHHPTLHQQMRAHNAAPSPATESSGGHRDERASARVLRRGLRKAYANLVGGSRPQSSGAVQAMLEDRCGVFVPDDVAQVLSSLGETLCRMCNSLLWCAVNADPVSSQLARFTRQQIHTKRVSLGSSMDTCNWRWSRRKNSS